MVKKIFTKHLKVHDHDIRSANIFIRPLLI